MYVKIVHVKIVLVEIMDVKIVLVEIMDVKIVLVEIMDVKIVHVEFMYVKIVHVEIVYVKVVFVEIMYVIMCVKVMFVEIITRQILAFTFSVTILFVTSLSTSAFPTFLHIAMLRHSYLACGLKSSLPNARIRQTGSFRLAAKSVKQNVANPLTNSHLNDIDYTRLPFPSRVTAMSRMRSFYTIDRPAASGPPETAVSVRPKKNSSSAASSESKPASFLWDHLSPDASTTLHYAYGQGLHFETLKSSGVKIPPPRPVECLHSDGGICSATVVAAPPTRRIGMRGLAKMYKTIWTVSILVSMDGCHVCDGRVALVFKHRGGQATLQSLKHGESPKYMPFGQRVHGVLYRMANEDMDRLAKLKQGYRLQKIEVELYDGRTANAVTFVSSPSELLPTEVVPPEGYMKLLREGSAQQFIDPIYQAWLSSIVTVCGAGLGPEYFNTPSNQRSVAMLCMSVILACLGLGLRVNT
eukprot:gene23700-9241_t